MIVLWTLSRRLLCLMLVLALTVCAMAGDGGGGGGGGKNGGGGGKDSGGSGGGGGKKGGGGGGGQGQPPAGTIVNSNGTSTISYNGSGTMSSLTGGMSSVAAPATNPFGTAGSFSPILTPQQYLQKLFQAPYDPTLRTYIPGYSYFQGVAYAAGDVRVAGQIRCLGVVVASQNANLQSGPMLTSNPDYMRGRLPSIQPRYVVVEWKEIP